MISSQPLIDKICCALTTGGLTAVQCCQAENALTLLCQPVFSVANIAALPNATTYNGRMVYVTSEAKYYYALLGLWSDDFSSTPHAIGCDVYAWGIGCDGRLGNNAAVSSRSPVFVVGGFTDWCQISAGGSHSLAVRTSGSAWAWGFNDKGQLGNNAGCVDGTNRSSPVSVVGGFTDWCQISAGSANSLAVRQNGTAWGWGCNSSGQLGDNTPTNRSSPVSVVGAFTDWCQVSTGSSFSLAVRTNGTAWAWGFNQCSRLGDGTQTTRSSPVSVIGGITDWCQVSASTGTFSLAVRQNGTAWSWGFGSVGQLGTNNVSAECNSPVTVLGGFTDWCQISAGGVHSLAVRQNGTAWAWGWNPTGELGDNTVVSKRSPISVIGGFTDWCQISAGYKHSLAVRTNGTAWSWGCNQYGQLGTNNTVSRSSPVSVVGEFTDWSQVSAGSSFSLGLKAITVPLQSI
jgi:alpha-tubulin suppressor-like RCC1 family protein